MNVIELGGFGRDGCEVLGAGIPDFWKTCGRQ